MSNLSNVVWKHVYFEPWIGDDYHREELKIMMLTESLYCWDDNLKSKGLVQGLILDHMLGHYLQRAYNNAKAVITGEYHSDNEDFWPAVIVYPYIQGFIGDKEKGGHRDKSRLYKNPKEVLDKSRQALSELMARLKDSKCAPNLIIVWGVGKIRGWLPQNYAWNRLDENLDIWTYGEFPETAFWFIRHPSCFFSYKKYHGFYPDVLNVMRNNNLI